jgi:hypothetical protein
VTRRRLFVEDDDGRINAIYGVMDVVASITTVLVEVAVESRAD